MPILVVCPTCKAEFKVSEKFAGKSGPCPKCKAPIKIPAVEAEVKIHAPEEAAAPPGKGKSKGSLPPGSLKPLSRQETNVRPLVVGGIIAIIVAAVAGAWFGAPIWRENIWLRGVALFAISIPIAAAGYSFLRNDELEPHRGGVLWLRATICGVIYAGMWAAFYFFVPPDMTQSSVNWIFLAPPFAAVGALTAYATLDLDFGSGFFHYAFYIVLTLALGYLSRLSMPWAGATL
jgi:hypothetical protein